MVDTNDREVTSASQPTGSEQVETEIVGGQEMPTPDPKVEAAIAEAADKGEMDGGSSPLSVQEAEVAHADAAYDLETPGAGVVEATVQEDFEARKELAGESHREVENDNLGELAVSEQLNSIRPDEKVQVVIRERASDEPSSFGVEDLEQEQIVKELAESGQLFDKGGPLVDWTGDRADLSDGVDGLFLAERSKQTGTKLF